MIKRCLLFLFLVLSLPSFVFSGELTPTEKRRLESDATDAFDVILRLWKDGKYEELYDCGHRKSRASNPREEFVAKMRKKVHEMASSWERVRSVDTEAASGKLVHVKAKIGYRKKKGGDTQFLTETYRMTLEDGQWRIDLSQILRTPF